MESKSAPKPSTQALVVPAGYESSGIRESLCLRVWVPDEQVGRIIGRKGAIVHHMQEETSTTVTLIPNLTDSAWHPISIRGDYGRVRRAFDMVASLVDEVDDVVMEFPLSRNHCAKIREATGRNSIPFISASNKTRINVPDNGEARVNIQLEGSISNVCYAFESILLVTSSNKSDISKGTDTNGNSTISPQSNTATTVEGKASNEDINKSRKKRKPKQSSSEESAPKEFSEKKGVLIPSAIVGLLLIRNIVTRGRTAPKTNVLSLIQDYTSTIISKDVSHKNALDTKKSENEHDGNNFDVAKNDRQEPLLFWVTGQTKAMVDLAAQSLDKIVAGDRINAVLKDLEELHQRYCSYRM